MMMRAFTAFGTASTLSLALFAGCSSEPKPQDLCHWLGDENSCYRTFSADVGARCGLDVTADATSGTSSDLTSSTNGAFGSRDSLDICIRNAGGTITFDPPLDLTTWPPTSVSFSITDSQGGTCGSGTYGGEFNYSVTVEKVDVEEDGCSDNWLGGNATLNDDITGGTFKMSQEEGRAAFDVTCPNNGDTFRFSTYNVSEAVLRDDDGNAVIKKNGTDIQYAEGACPSCAPLLPRAEFLASPGVANIDASQSLPGYVRLRVFYPQTEKTQGDKCGNTAPTTTSDSSSVATTERNDAQCSNTENFVVEYFNCSIPAPPSPCADGVKNNDETDIDCGGSTCGITCAAGLSCKVDTDCQSGSCALNGGVLQCT